MRKEYLIKTLLLLLLLSAASEATPSTQIWNPSTDIQAKGAWHFGIDNYFTVQGPADGGYAFPTDAGLEYGLTPNIELGLDIFEPQASPLAFNAKFGLPENESIPAFAVGGYGFGTSAGVTDQNVLYGVVAKTFPAIGRLTAGYFSGNYKVLVDPSGNPDNSGIILTWDKYLTDKIWACVDYAGTKSTLGALFYGFSYAFSPNTSIIFGYGTYNNGAKPVVTTQLDINI
ncbi:MAG: hypothetical protein NTZ10_06790 [Candidatus Saganbacteria bacterium]|nr:hypothetical protein [Candidatus Saganbacteria bacterium]